LYIPGGNTGAPVMPGYFAKTNK